MKNLKPWLLVVSLLISCSQVWADTNQKSFTPSKYLYPIMEIDLLKADSTDTQILYKCSGATAAECLVNMADSTSAGYAAITAAAQNVSIKAGTYTQAKLWNCPAGTTGTDTTTMTIQGTASVGSGPTTMATAATGMVAGSTPADTVITWGCGGALVTFPTPIVVAAGSTQTLSLLVDLTNSLWTDPSASAGMGGCMAGTGGAYGICGSFPLVVPYVGTGTPTFERYYIAHSSTVASPAAADENAAVNLAIDPDGDVFYAGVQPYFTESSPSSSSTTKGGPDYNTATRTFSANADGSIALQTGGSSIDNRVGFTAFSRADHTGTTKNELTASTTWFYKAYKQ